MKKNSLQIFKINNHYYKYRKKIITVKTCVILNITKNSFKSLIIIKIFFNKLYI